MARHWHYLFCDTNYLIAIDVIDAAFLALNRAQRKDFNSYTICKQNIYFANQMHSNLFEELFKYILSEYLFENVRIVVLIHVFLKCLYWLNNIFLSWLFVVNRQWKVVLTHSISFKAHKCLCFEHSSRAHICYIDPNQIIEITNQLNLPPHIRSLGVIPSFVFSSFHSHIVCTQIHFGGRFHSTFQLFRQHIHRIQPVHCIYRVNETIEIIVYSNC